MKRILRMICLAISALLVFGVVAEVLPTTVRAATEYSLSDLLTNGRIKPMGRTQVSQTGTGITAEWSGNGFEINVSGGTTFTVGFESSRTNYAVIQVDGKEVLKATCAKGTGTFGIELPDTGSHAVKVFMENAHSSKSTDYFRFTTLSFDGTIGERPADKELFIELIGDSVGCGAGAVGVFQPGVLWSTADHSAQASLGWYLSEMLDADLSIVARGGIGLLGNLEDSMESIEAGTKTNSMLDIYPYASGHHTDEGKYVPTDKPDLVVLELGANDSLKYNNPTKTAEWRIKLEQMIQLVRDTYQDQELKILLYYQSAIPYSQMLDIADKDPNIYSCHYYFHGNGSIAKVEQLSGHPDASDQYKIAEVLFNCIKEQDILGLHGENVKEPAYIDVPYYVSVNGDDANDGKSIDTAKPSFTAAVAQAVADKDSLTDDSRVVIYLDSGNGEVPNYIPVDPSDNDQFLGGAEAVTSSSGKKLPVLVTTYNYGAEGVAKAVLDSSHTAKNNGHGSLVMYNDFTFRSITIQGTTDETTKYRDRNLYSGYNEVVFDDVTFSHAGETPTDSKNQGGWRISAGLFGSFALPESDAVASITFQNGDYTGLNYVTGVNASTVADATENTHAIHKVIIGEGATMGTVVGLYNTFAPQSVTVEFRGGTVESYAATKSGKESAPMTYNTNLTTIFNGGSIQNAKYYGTGNYATFNGNVTNEFRKGLFSGRVFAGMGSNVTLNGNLTNKISGGEIRVEPAADGDGFFLAGYNNVTINGNVTNNITTGDLNLLFKTANMSSGIYLGLRSGNINGNLTNNISGGNLYAANYVAGLEDKGNISASIYLGMAAGNITGTLTNKITAGTIDASAAGCNEINFGTQDANYFIGKMVSVIGSAEDSKHGPRLEGSVILGNNMGRVGKDLGNVTPDASACNSNVVIDNTIYSGVFGGRTYAAANHTINGDYYSYVIGSVRTNIYGGKFSSLFYGTGASPVYGHVETNISGGYFTGIYGAGPDAIVHDGVETNISNFEEFLCDGSSDSVKNLSKIYAGGAAARISAATAGEPVKLTFNLPAEKRLITPVYAGFATGGTASKVKVELKNGILPTINSSAENETFAGSVELVVSGGKVEKLVPVNSGATIQGGVTCTVSGGTVNSYVGTASGTAEAAVTCTTYLTTNVSGGKVKSYMGTGDYVNFEGLIHNNICGGQVSGAQFAGLGNNVTLTGNLTNTVSSGRILVNPTTSNSHGIFLSGRDNCTINGDVTNNISDSGMVVVTFKKDDIASAIYFGGRSNTNINGNLTNNVSGGTIGANASDGVTPGTTGFYAGSTSGGVTGTLTNNLSGGKFAFTSKGTFYLSGQATSTYAGKIVNVLGDPETGNGPSFSTPDGNIQLAGNWGKLGVSSNIGTMPTEVCDDIVISNTIYGGTYGGDVICSLQSTSASYVRYTKGSVQTDVYGGTFNKYFRCAGGAPIFGSVCTNIHGGTFKSNIYGAYGCEVKNGVKLNIFGLDADFTKTIRASYNATISSVQPTAPALTLTIAHPGKFSGTIYAASTNCTINGDIHVAVSAGTYPNGFAIDGVTVKEALAEGYSLLNTETGEVITLPDDAIASDEISVTVGIPVAANEELNFNNASVVLRNDLGMNFKLPNPFTEGGYTAPYAVFQLGDKETKVETYSVDGDKAVFKFRNIAPHRMGETITATLYATKDGVLYSSEPITYSVKQYCYAQLQLTTSEKLRTLLVDLLNYGSVSQQYVDNSITADKLVSCNLTDEQKAWASTGELTLQNITKVGAELADPTVSWKAAGLYLEKSVDIRLKLQASSIEGLSVKFVVGDTTYEVTSFTPVSGEENCYYVYLTRLNAGQMRQEVKATVYKDGSAVSNSLTYSIESYAAEKQDATSPQYLAELVKAMMRYGDSAAAYTD